jgi:ATP-dependent DNA helicase RecG
MLELKMVDTIGSGIRRMFNLQRQRFFPMPDYDLTDNKVKVTIVGRVLDMDYATLLTKDRSLNLTEIELLSRIQMHKTLTDYEIAYLRKRKLVEGRKGSLHLSESVAKNIGRKAEYDKKKGYKDEHYREKILAFIKDNGSASRKDIDSLLMPILPDALTEKQKITKIGHLLATMKKTGVIDVGEKKAWIYTGDK